ncbi:hypothetical protein ACFWGD_02800 [Corynebacterium sp. NPDC060344]|uniref:hypothetical protein n=1 Tax=Corynebacterium sp. NPDC060344 TaxID=3347101 RepID=UPI0036503CAA
MSRDRGKDAMKFGDWEIHIGPLVYGWHDGKATMNEAAAKRFEANSVNGEVYVYLEHSDMDVWYEPKGDRGRWAEYIRNEAKKLGVEAVEKGFTPRLRRPPPPGILF